MMIIFSKNVKIKFSINLNKAKNILMKKYKAINKSIQFFKINL